MVHGCPCIIHYGERATQLDSMCPTNSAVAAPRRLVDRAGIAVGFLASGDGYADGNYALLDIVAALRWVGDNVDGGEGSQTKWVGRCWSFQSLTWIGSIHGLGWIGSGKMDLCPTLGRSFSADRQTVQSSRSSSSST